LTYGHGLTSDLIGNKGSLHHVKFYDNVPYVQVQALDQIGKAVVTNLIANGKNDGGEYNTNGSIGTRLKLDPWGWLMLVILFLFLSILVVLNSGSLILSNQ
jgi:hypothetical protein